MPLLFLLFVLFPILELFVLIWVGSEIGALPTVCLVLLTAVTGIYLLRRQSRGTAQRAQSRLQVGQVPAQELMEGFLIGVGGVLLLCPGFITDALALVVLVPWTRRRVMRWLLQPAHFAAVSRSGFTFSHFGGVRPPGTGPGANSDVFEGEFTRERDSSDRLKGPPDA